MLKLLLVSRRTVVMDVVRQLTPTLKHINCVQIGRFCSLFAFLKHHNSPLLVATVRLSSHIYIAALTLLGFFEHCSSCLVFYYGRHGRVLTSV